MDEVKSVGSAYRHYTVKDFLDLARDRYPRADQQARRLAGRTIVPVLIDHNFDISTLADLLASYYNVKFGFTLDNDGIMHLMFGIYHHDSVACVDFVRDDFDDTVILLDDNEELSYRVCFYVSMICYVLRALNVY